MNISFTVRGNSFGIYEVDPTNITKEYLRVFRDLLAGRPQTQPSSHAPEATTIDSSISLDDCDNAGVSQDPIEENGKKEDLKIPMSWQTFRDEMIPSAIRTITFIVHGSDMNAALQGQIEQQFPGVLLVRESSSSSEILHANVEANKLSETSETHFVGQHQTDLTRNSILQYMPCDQEARISDQTGTERCAHVEGELLRKSGTSELDMVLVAPNCNTEKTMHAKSNESCASTSTEPDHHPPPNDQDVRLQRTRGSCSTPTASPLLDIRADIKLELFETVALSPLKRMFKQWQDYGELKQWAPKLGDVQQFNLNLVRLYILDYYEKQMLSSPKKISLASAVLLQFQATAYQHGGDIPKFETAAYAYKYLPYFSPLCRWIRIEYAYLWGTQDELISYKKMPKTFPELDDMAFTDAKALLDLMYGVTWERDPHIRGHDAAVLSRWCEVHNHADVGEKALCDKMRPHVQAWLKDAEEEQERQRLEDAISEFQKHDNLVAMKNRLQELRTKTKTKKSKRKAEGSPVRLATHSKKTRTKNEKNRTKDSLARHNESNGKSTTNGKKRRPDVSPAQPGKKSKKAPTNKDREIAGDSPRDLQASILTTIPPS
jgi:hypothetical protein